MAAALALVCASCLAPVALAQKPPNPAKSPVGAFPQPTRRNTAAQPANQLDGNQALFTVLAAINVAGYDTQIDAVSTHPFRHTLRTELGTRNIESIFQLKRFFRDHHLADPNAELSQYISYALLINGAPLFDYKDPDMVRPPDASALEGLSPILATFYKEANLEAYWQRAQPFYDQMIELYHAPVSRTVLEANAFARNTTNGFLGRHFQIYVDLLGAPNQTQARSYGDEYYVVVTPSVEPQLDRIRHGYLHFLIDPLGLKYGEEITKKHALADYAQGAPLLSEHYKMDFVDLTTECIIKAMEARLNHKPIEVEQAMKEGYVLTAAMAENLAAYEQQDVALRLYFPTLITSLDFKREEQRLSNFEFAATSTNRVVRPAQKLEPPVLTGAAKTLDDAESAYTVRDLARAKEGFLKVMEQTAEQPLHAKAYYGLARVAVLEKDPETGDRLFRKVLESEPDVDTKSWSLLYLARLADSQGERGQAVEFYQAALALKDGPETVRQAAQKGVDQAFKK